MASVTQRIKQIKQPYGGFVPLKHFQIKEIDDDCLLSDFDKENIPPSIVGLAVDYLTRYQITGSLTDAFSISIKGAISGGFEHKALDLLKNINGLDDKSINSACKLCSYDVYYRYSPLYESQSIIKPNTYTISNIRTMVQRTLSFFDYCGGTTMNGFTFEGAYNNTISSGDGDYLTKDTLWDIKVSKRKPTSRNTLQLLIYYLMGIRSIYPEFQAIDYIGIFNPKLGKIYTMKIADISNNIISEVSRDIMGYNDVKIINRQEEKWKEQRKSLDKYMIDWEKDFDR